MKEDHFPGAVVIGIDPDHFTGVSFDYTHHGDGGVELLFCLVDGHEAVALGRVLRSMAHAFTSAADKVDPRKEQDD